MALAEVGELPLGCLGSERQCFQRGQPEPEIIETYAPGALLADLARSLLREVASVENALEAEQWASYVEGTWRSRSPLAAEATDAFAKDLVRAVERRGGDKARAALTAHRGGLLRARRRARPGSVRAPHREGCR